MDDLRKKLKESDEYPLITFASELETGCSKIKEATREGGVTLSLPQEKELADWTGLVQYAQEVEDSASEQVKRKHKEATEALLGGAFVKAHRVLCDLERHDALLAQKLQIDLVRLHDNLNSTWQQWLVELWSDLKETKDPTVLKRLEPFLADNWGRDQEIPGHVETSRLLLADAEGGANLNQDDEAIRIWNEVVVLTNEPELSSFIGETLQTKPKTIRDGMARILVADNPNLVKAMILMAYYDSAKRYRDYIATTLSCDVARLIARLKKDQAAQ